MALGKTYYTNKDFNTGYIYVILNLKNNKSYIGKTFFPKKRFNDHIKQDKLSIDKEITKYGAENFLFVIVEEANKKELDKKELEWINKVNSYKNGYNEKDW